jgi:hypothetical protein
MYQAANNLDKSLNLSYTLKCSKIKGWFKRETSSIFFCGLSVLFSDRAAKKLLPHSSTMINVRSSNEANMPITFKTVIANTCASLPLFAFLGLADGTAGLARKGVVYRGGQAEKQERYRLSQTGHGETLHSSWRFVVVFCRQVAILA